MSALTKMRIDDFATMKYGKMPPKNVISDEGYPIYSGYRITGFAKEYLYKEPELIVVARGVGGTGDVKISPPESWITNLSIVLTLSSELVDKTFLYYRLGREPLKERLNTGAAQAQITIENLRSYEIELPNLNSQRRIASVLKAYDNLIENNQRRIALLEEAARLLYREWFIHFRFPGREHIKIIDGVPEGWELVPFADLAEYLNGFAFKPMHLGDEGLPIVKIPELKGGVLGKTPRYDGSDVPEKFLLDTGDLIFSWSGTLAVDFWVSGQAYLNQHLFKVTPTREASAAFLLIAIREAMPQFMNQSVGATMKHIRRSALSDVCVMMPPKHILDDFQSTVDTQYEQIRTLKQNNVLLAEARDLLLPRLMDGRLEI